MSVDYSSFADPVLTDAGAGAFRQAQAGPSGGPDIVSADGHWEITDDIFYDSFPLHLKDKAPRVWYDKYWRIGYPGVAEAFGLGERVENSIMKGLSDDVWNLELRLSHMDAEGVQKEVIFPQSLLGFARYSNFEVHENMYRIYNEYIAARGKASKGRFYGVGICSNWWDPEKAEQAIQQIVDLGIKTYMLPVNPGMTLDGKKINYAGREMEKFWSIATAAGLPVNFHIGEGPTDLEERAGIARFALLSFRSLQKPLAELIFGGVFDRNPHLTVVFTEGGISWVPPFLQDAEMIYDTFGRGDVIDDIKHRPSHYWHNNCYATFQNDLIGLRQLDYLGADRVMWAVDYPHSEGSFGLTQKSIQSVLNATNLDNAKKILAGNAIRVYKLS